MEDNNKRDQLDQMLDAALARYAAVEPRIGLEERVLASLRAESTKVAPSSWFRWSALAAASAMTLAITMIAWKSGAPLHPPVAQRPSITKHSIAAPNAAASASQSAASTAVIPEPMPALAAEKHHLHAAIVTVAPPKLQQFPSPEPLSEQEKILANYVAQFHRQAALIARVNNEELTRDRIEVFGNSESPDEVADQQTTNR